MGAIASLSDQTMAIGNSSIPAQAFMVQPLSKWVDASDWTDAIFTADIAKVTATGTLTLAIYTCSILDTSLASATLIATMGTMSTLTSLKKKVINTQDSWPIEKYVFWKVTASGTAGAWEAFFRVEALFKGGSARRRARPAT